MPDGIGQVDHLTLEDRPQSPLPPAVVGDEPHQGAEAYARLPQESRSRTWFSTVGGGHGRDGSAGQRPPWAALSCAPEYHGGRTRSRYQPWLPPTEPRTPERGALPWQRSSASPTRPCPPTTKSCRASTTRQPSGSRASSARSTRSSSTARSAGPTRTYEEPSPIDSDIVIGRFSQATPKDVDDAVAAAKAFQLEWDRMGWQERVRHHAQRRRHHGGPRLFDLAALMAYEVGKSRLEALGDVQETAELIRWNADEMDEARGVPRADERAWAPPATTTTCCGRTACGRSSARSTSRWRCPAGRRRGALVAGNAVVLKPSNQGALLGYKLYECYRDGGVPAGAFHLVHRPRRRRRRCPVASPGRRRHHVHRLLPGRHGHLQELRDATFPKPVICEMGGKNPAIVTKNADLDKATDGVMRSAFGFGGQKCSACSPRVRRTRGLRRLRGPAEGEDRDGSRSVTRSSGTSTWARSSTKPPWRRSRRPRRRRRRTARSSPAAQRLTDGDFGRGLVRRAHDRRGARRTTGSGKKELFVPFVGGRGVRRARRRDREGERHGVRPDRRASSARTRPRSTSGSTASRQAWST